MRRRTERLRAVSMATALLFFLSLLVPLSALAERPPRRRKKPNTGSVEIFSFVKGAEVEINGKRVGLTPLKSPLVLKPGTYTVRVHKRGHTEFLETITVTAGLNQEVEADLIAFAGLVRIEANVNGATVAIDGKLAGSVPFDRDVPAGRHEIAVQAAGYQPFKKAVNVEAGKPLALRVTLVPTPIEDPGTTEPGIASQWWFWTIIGVVVAGGATAAGVVATSGEEIVAPSSVNLQLEP